MLFRISLYVSLFLFVLGILYRTCNWFRREVGKGGKGTPPSVRLTSAMRGTFKALTSKRIFYLIKTLLMDVFLQLRILQDKDDRILWVMHILIFVGFMLLVIMHALGSLLTQALFSDYQSTLNPFLFLRNFFGVLVCAGLVLAIMRRSGLKKNRVRTTGMDSFVIVVFIVIIVSGFLLEGAKISSSSIFRQMTEDYATVANAGEHKALEAYWVAEFGVISSDVKEPLPRELVARGKEVHEMSCASCHSRPQSAFISYPLSRAMKPVAQDLDEVGFPKALWIIHFMACFVGLAYLPFSKMFHIIATPVSLLVASAGEGKEDPATEATRNVIELDGCRHGGTCHPECPVRQMRQERINQTHPFEPEVDFLGGKSWKELGCRPFNT